MPPAGVASVQMPVQPPPTHPKICWPVPSRAGQPHVLPASHTASCLLGLLGERSPLPSLCRGHENKTGNFKHLLVAPNLYMPEHSLEETGNPSFQPRQRRVRHLGIMAASKHQRKEWEPEGSWCRLLKLLSTGLTRKVGGGEGGKEGEDEKKCGR